MQTLEEMLVETKSTGKARNIHNASRPNYLEFVSDIFCCSIRAKRVVRMHAWWARCRSVCVLGGDGERGEVLRFVGLRGELKVG